MTVEQFVNAYEGKEVDYDRNFGAQCVDLFRQYGLEVLNITEKLEGVVGAKDLYNNFDNMPKTKKYYEKVKSPQKGDIVVFGGGEYGHVGIVLFATSQSLVIFEQQGYTKDPSAKIGIWNYTRVLGFLRRK